MINVLLSSWKGHMLFWFRNQACYWVSYPIFLASKCFFKPWFSGKSVLYFKFWDDCWGNNKTWNYEMILVKHGMFDLFGFLLQETNGYEMFWMVQRPSSKHSLLQMLLSIIAPATSTALSSLLDVIIRERGPLIACKAAMFLFGTNDACHRATLVTMSSSCGGSEESRCSTSQYIKAVLGNHYERWSLILYTKGSSFIN